MIFVTICIMIKSTTRVVLILYILVVSILASLHCRALEFWPLPTEINVNTPRKRGWPDSHQPSSDLINANTPSLSSKCIVPSQTYLHTFFLSLLFFTSYLASLSSFDLHPYTLLPFSRHYLKTLHHCNVSPNYTFNATHLCLSFNSPLEPNR